MKSYNPTLAASVENAVNQYLASMKGQDVTDLYDLVLTEMEAPLLQCILEFTDYNQSKTAAILGLNRGTLRQKLKKYGLL